MPPSFLYFAVLYLIVVLCYLMVHNFLTSYLHAMSTDFGLLDKYILDCGSRVSEPVRPLPDQYSGGKKL